MHSPLTPATGAPAGAGALEALKSTARINHRLAEKEIAAVLSSASSVAAAHGENCAAAVDHLTSLVSRLHGLKRKMEEGARAEEQQRHVPLNEKVNIYEIIFCQRPEPELAIVPLIVCIRCCPGISDPLDGFDLPTSCFKAMPVVAANCPINKND